MTTGAHTTRWQSTNVDDSVLHCRECVLRHPLPTSCLMWSWKASLGRIILRDGLSWNQQLIPWISWVNEYVWIIFYKDMSRILWRANNGQTATASLKVAAQLWNCSSVFGGWDVRDKNVGFLVSDNRLAYKIQYDCAQVLSTKITFVWPLYLALSIMPKDQREIRQWGNDEGYSSVNDMASERGGRMYIINRNILTCRWMGDGTANTDYRCRYIRWMELAPLCHEYSEFDGGCSVSVVPA